MSVAQRSKLSGMKKKEKEKMFNKILDSTKDLTSRVKSLRTCLDTTDADEMRAVLSATSYAYYYVWYDFYTIHVDPLIKGTKTLSKDAKEDVDLMLFVIEKLLHLMPEKLQSGWHCNSLSAFLKRLLLPGNASAYRYQGLRIFLAWFQIVRTRAPADMVLLFSTLVPGLDDAFSRTAIDRSDSNRAGGAWSVELLPLVPAGAAPDLAKQTTPQAATAEATKLMSHLLHNLIRNIGLTHWADGSGGGARESFEFMLNQFKQKYLFKIFQDYNHKADLYGDNKVCEGAQELSDERQLVVEMKVLVIRWLINILPSSNPGHGMEQSSIVQSQSRTGLEQPPSSDLVTSYRIAYQVLTGSRENINMCLEILRQGLLLPLSEIDVTSDVLKVFRSWLELKSEAERPIFLQNPLNCELAAVDAALSATGDVPPASFRPDSVSTPHPKAAAAMSLSCDEHTLRAAMQKSRAGRSASCSTAPPGQESQQQLLRAGFQKYLQYLFRAVSVVFYIDYNPTSSRQVKALMEMRMKKAVFMFRRAAILNDSPSSAPLIDCSETWVHAIHTLLAATSHVFVTGRHRHDHNRHFISSILNTLIVNCVMSNLYVRMERSIWDDLTRVLSSIAYFDLVIEQWAKTMQFLTVNILAPVVYGVDLKQQQQQPPGQADPPQPRSASQSVRPAAAESLLTPKAAADGPGLGDSFTHQVLYTALRSAPGASSRAAAVQSEARFAGATNHRPARPTSMLISSEPSAAAHSFGSSNIKSRTDDSTTAEGKGVFAGLHSPSSMGGFFKGGGDGGGSGGLYASKSETCLYVSPDRRGGREPYSPGTLKRRGSGCSLDDDESDTTESLQQSYSESTARAPSPSSPAGAADSSCNSGGGPHDDSGSSVHSGAADLGAQLQVNTSLAAAGHTTPLRSSWSGGTDQFSPISDHSPSVQSMEGGVPAAAAALDQSGGADTTGCSSVFQHDTTAGSSSGSSELPSAQLDRGPGPLHSLNLSARSAAGRHSRGLSELDHTGSSSFSPMAAGAAHPGCEDMGGGGGENEGVGGGSFTTWCLTSEHSRSLVAGGQLRGWWKDNAVILWQRLLGSLGDVNEISAVESHARVLHKLIELFYTLEAIAAHQSYLDEKQEQFRVPEFVPPSTMLLPWALAGCALSPATEGVALAHQLACRIVLRYPALDKRVLAQFYRTVHRTCTGPDADLRAVVTRELCGLFGQHLPGSTILLKLLVHNAAAAVTTPPTTLKMKVCEEVGAGLEVQSVPFAQAVTLLNSLLCFPGHYRRAWRCLDTTPGQQPQLCLYDMGTLANTLFDSLSHIATNHQLHHTASCYAISSMAIAAITSAISRNWEGSFLDKSIQVLLNVLLQSVKGMSVSVGDPDHMRLSARAQLTAFHLQTVSELLLDERHTSLAVNIVLNLTTSIAVLNSSNLCDANWSRTALSLITALHEWCLKVDPALLHAPAAAAGPESTDTLLGKVTAVLGDSVSLAERSGGEKWAATADTESTEPADSEHSVDNEWRTPASAAAHRGHSSHSVSSTGRDWAPEVETVAQAARIVSNVLLSTVGHYPSATGGGVAKLDSAVSELDDNPFASSDQPSQLVSAIDNPLCQVYVHNESTIITVLELRNQHTGASTRESELPLSSRVTRFIIRDISGKYCWDATAVAELSPDSAIQTPKRVSTTEKTHQTCNQVQCPVRGHDPVGPSLSVPTMSSSFESPAAVASANQSAVFEPVANEGTPPRRANQSGLSEIEEVFSDHVWRESPAAAAGKRRLKQIAAAAAREESYSEPDNDSGGRTEHASQSSTDIIEYLEGGECVAADPARCRNILTEVLGHLSEYPELLHFPPQRLDGPPVRLRPPLGLFEPEVAAVQHLMQSQALAELTDRRDLGDHALSPPPDTHASPASYDGPSDTQHDTSERDFAASVKLLGQLNWFSFINRQSLALLNKCPAALVKEIRHLDSLVLRESHKLAVIYIGSGQETKSAILANSRGSVEYEQFVAGLGWEVELGSHRGYTGGLAGSNGSTLGSTTPYFATPTYEVAFHVATRMATADLNQKWRHIGNDHVHIVWSEHSRPFRRSILPTQFADVLIVLRPLPNRLFHVAIHCKKEVDGSEIGPLVDGSIVNFPSLPTLVRATALRASQLCKQAKNAPLFFAGRSGAIQSIVKRFKVAQTFEDFVRCSVNPACSPAPASSPAPRTHTSPDGGSSSCSAETSQSQSTSSAPAGKGLLSSLRA